MRVVRRGPTVGNLPTTAVALEVARLPLGGSWAPLPKLRQACWGRACQGAGAQGCCCAGEAGLYSDPGGCGAGWRGCWHRGGTAKVIDLTGQSGPCCHQSPQPLPQQLQLMYNRGVAPRNVQAWTGARQATQRAAITPSGQGSPRRRSRPAAAAPPARSSSRTGSPPPGGASAAAPAGGAHARRWSDAAA